jgi:hypothetical protein
LLPALLTTGLPGPTVLAALLAATLLFISLLSAL